MNASLADDTTESIDEGVLIFGDASYTLPYSIDLLYITAFYAIDRYSAVARRATAQGPLGPVGILFEGSGIGRIGSALDNTAQDAAGGAIGYQQFFNHTRTQVITELGARFDTDEPTALGDAVGVGVRVQHAMGQHYIARLDWCGSFS